MILFLDFDGVLHPELPGRPDDFSSRPHLWEILRACPGVEVVFATAWRELHSFDELVVFATQGGGEDLAHRFIGATPVMQDVQYRREAECRQWLADSGQQGRPWLALEDFDSYFSPACPTLYMVDYRTGLTEPDVAMLIARLNGER